MRLNLCEMLSGRDTGYSFEFLKEYLRLDHHLCADNAVQYYQYHDSNDTRSDISKESLGITSIGYI